MLWRRAKQALCLSSRNGETTLSVKVKSPYASHRGFILFLDML